MMKHLSLAAPLRRALLAAAAIVAAAGCGSPQSEAAAPAAPAAAAAAPAPVTADTVLEAYLDATGGRTAHAKAQSSYTRGKVTMVGMNVEGTFEVFAAAPRKLYTVVTLAGLGKIESGCDGEVAWEKNAMSGNRILQGGERDRQLRSATFNGELQWKELYRSIELQGEEPFEGRAAYKVVFTAADGSTENSFYDKETHLLLGQSMVVATQMGQIPIKSTVSDYRTVDGVKVAFVSAQEFGGTNMVMTAEEVRYDVPAPAGTFDLPAEIRALQKPAAK